MKLLKKLYLYFLPGIVPTMLMLIIHKFYGENLPSITILIVLDFLVTIPLMIYLISNGSGQTSAVKAIEDIFHIKMKIDFRKTVGLILFSLLWAIGSFILLKPVNEFLQQYVFAWIPEWFNPGILTIKQGSCIQKISWLLMIPFSILMPLMEEIYFRGFLLSREKLHDWRAPLINTLLFCAYHIWSPQLFVTRVIAIFPMNYLVWRYKNIFLSIVPHVLLNLIGDILLTYPMVFSS